MYEVFISFFNEASIVYHSVENGGRHTGEGGRREEGGGGEGRERGRKEGEKEEIQPTSCQSSGSRDILPIRNVMPHLYYYTK